MTEHLHFHFSLSCIGEGNGNPLQCSCLENPRDGEAWWAVVYGVAQSQTRVKWLNSSSSSSSWVNEAMLGLCVWCTCVLMDEKNQFLPLPTPAAHGESRLLQKKEELFWVVSLKSLVQRSTDFGTRDQFHGRRFFHGLGKGGLRMLQVNYIYCALYFYYHDISSISDHQALNPRGWGPLA